jgi:hypothetical protein
MNPAACKVIGFKQPTPEDLDHALLSRFLTGKRSLTLPAVARVCDLLGLALAPVAPAASGDEAGTAATVEPPPPQDAANKPRRRRKTKAEASAERGED